MKRSKQIFVALVLAAGMSFAGQAPDKAKLYPRRTPVVEVYEKVQGSVVNISSSRVVPGGLGLDIFGDIFHLPGPFGGKRRLTSLGSGFVIHADGYVVTNYHVVARATDILVSTSDGQEFAAKLVRADVGHDLAVLKLDTSEALPQICLGTARDLMVGETVIAVGNPLGYHHTVTTGVASAVGRRLEFGEGLEYSNLIQTSAPINPGSSGGPLLNINGEVVGINTAIRFDAQNIGFAMSIDELTQRLGKLLRPKGMRELGAGLTVNLGRKAGQTGLEVRVERVATGSSAERARIQRGDIIAAVAGKRISGLADYYLAWQGVSEGQKVAVELLRRGPSGQVAKRVEVRATYESLADVRKLAWEKLGMRLDTSKEPSAETVGYRVMAVEAGGPARRAGVRVGDLLFAIGKQQLEDSEVLAEALEEITAGQKIMLGWSRKELLGISIQHRAAQAR
jgi:serine protease Do